MGACPGDGRGTDNKEAHFPVCLHSIGQGQGVPEPNVNRKQKLSHLYRGTQKSHGKGLEKKNRNKF